jgi:ectoine hydroxylase-related dioxygenase (phytanoyl-CoA dioxygenase family)
MTATAQLLPATAQAVPADAGPLVLDAGTVDRFHRDGFTVLRGLLTPAEVAFYRAASLRLSEAPDARLHIGAGRGPAPFRQLVNAWREDAGMASLTLHARLLAAVRQIMGRPMRLWHDHILTKPPRNGLASEFHQDQPYWPIGRRAEAISAWIALGDTPVEHGCMSFIPGTQGIRAAAAQDLTSATSLFGMRPELRLAERVTVPLAAGDCTFHGGFTAHFAGPNQLDVPRVAHVVIFVEAEARCTGDAHVIFGDAPPPAGACLPDDLCPRI